MDKPAPHHVVIVGGGFGGLHLALRLKRAAARITLIDRRNFHLFQPLLYQVATGGLSPANIATPLRAVLKRQKNVTVLLGEVVGVDPAERQVRLANGDKVTYDSLVVATGVRHAYFGNDPWEAFAPGLKTIEDATKIRARILQAFEAAERETDPDEIARQLTFVIIGGGPTGVELAGAVAELARHTLKHDFRNIDSTQAKIVLVEGAETVLPAYPPDLAAKAVKSLEHLGVTVRAGAKVTDIGPESVTIDDQGQSESLRTCNVFWAAGVQASRLGKRLADATGAELDRLGRVTVEADCSLPGHPQMFVIGDLAHFDQGHDGPLAGVAPVAIQQGRYVANVIRRRIEGKPPRPPFAYVDRGTMATIGRAAAVAHIGRLHLGGLVAWLLWLFVHLMLLVGFENRLLVFTQWAWNYFTRNRAARLITREHVPAPDRRAEATSGDEVDRR